jgi:hypothetical protein
MSNTIIAFLVAAVIGFTLMFYGIIKLTSGTYYKTYQARLAAVRLSAIIMYIGITIVGVAAVAIMILMPS